MHRKYSIGIDLHGTLLNKREELEREDVEDLKNAIRRVKRFAKVFTCTGNDLLFVKEKLAPIFGLFDGFVLETGCVISMDGKTEKVITTRKERETISELYELCLQRDFKWVTDANRRRLTTISLFAKNLAKHYAEVKQLVKNKGLAEEVTVTYSSVAVDIIPAGYNKFTGLYELGKKTKLVGIADSMNDTPLILNVDYACVPANAAPELLEKVGKKKKIVDVNSWKKLDERIVVKAGKKESRGVIELLEKLNEIIG